jgi:hypothetical protein
METIKIYEADGTEWWEVKVAVNCKYSDELEGDEYVELQWESYDYVRIPVGSYVIYNARIYRLAEPHEPTRRTESIYTFNPVFYAQPYHWKKAQAVLYEYGSTVTYTDSNNTISATIPTPTSRELDWQFTGNLPDALFMLIQMIKNETGETWTAHYVPEIQNKIIEYSAQGSSLYDFMSKIAEQCGKEFYFDYANATPQVCFGTLELESTGTHTEDGRVLLYVGDDVSNPSVSSNEEDYFTRFYFFGSTRNVDQPNSVTKSSVVNRRLPLCPSLVTATGFTDLNYYPQGFIDIDRTADSYTNREYIPTLPQYKVYAKSVFFDDIYPHADLKISSVQTRHIAVVDDAGAETGENMPIYFVKLANGDGTAFTFNNGTYPNGDMLPTLVPSIAFRSGYLQGLEYELIYHPTDFTVSTTGTEGSGGRVTISAPCFEIVFDTNSNPRLPNDNIKPQANDQCTLFNIHMPNEYVWNAQRELEQKAIDYINELNVDKSTYELQSNPVKFENVTALKELKVGKKVKMLYPNGEVVLSRVIAIEKHLDLPCDCKITLGYSARQGTIQTLRQIIDDTSENVETVVKTGDKTRAQILGLKNGYLAQKETFDAAFDADGYFDGSRIKPLTVETQALKVGSRSQQFALSGVDFSVAKYTSGEGILSWNGTNGKLSHFTIDETCVLQWNIPTGSQSLSLYGTTTESQYIYAKVAKDGFPATATGGIKVNSNNGEFVVTPEQKKFDTDTQYYYFLVGTVSSELTDSDSTYKTRIISLTYGTTTINGKQITTGVIRSSDPNHGVVINLDTGEIIGKIRFLSNSGQVLDSDKYVNSVVDVGGRNLIARTGTSVRIPESGTATSQWTYKVFTIYDLPFIQGETVWVNAKITVHSGSITALSVIFFNSALTTSYATYQPTLTNGKISFKLTVPSALAGKTDAVFLVYAGLHGACMGNAITVSELKVERGETFTDWTPAPEDAKEFTLQQREAVESGIQYLKTALRLAQQGETIIDGGLVLSTMIGVLEQNGQLQAALNGCAGQNDPIIMSGMVNSQNMARGTFRVYPDGHIEIHKTESELINIADGEILFKTSTETRNRITTSSMTDIATTETNVTSGGSGSGSLVSSASTTSVKQLTLLGVGDWSEYVPYPWASGGGYSAYATPPYTRQAVVLYDSGSLTLSKNADVTIPAFSVTINNVTSVNTITYSGNITVDRGFGILHNEQTAWLTETSGSHTWCSIGIYRGSTAVATLYSNNLGYIGHGSSKTVSVSQQTLRGLQAGTYKLRVAIEVNIDNSRTIFETDPNNPSYTVNTSAVGAKTAYTANIPAITGCSISYNAYQNVIYRDGIFLSKKNTDWFAVDPNAGSSKYGLIAAKCSKTDRTMMHFTAGTGSSSATIRFGINGLLQKLGTFDATSAFCRVNMMVFAGDFWYNNGTWSYSIKFNPLGLTISTSHIKEGHFQLTHNIGHTDYFVLGCGFADQSSQGDTATNPNDRGCYVTFYNRTSSTVKIRLADDSTGNNYECYLVIIDFRQYTY